jgi:hypothetical protein
MMKDRPARTSAHGSAARAGPPVRTKSEVSRKERLGSMMHSLGLGWLPVDATGIDYRRINWPSQLCVKSGGQDAPSPKIEIETLRAAIQAWARKDCIHFFPVKLC